MDDCGENSKSSNFESTVTKVRGQICHIIYCSIELMHQTYLPQINSFTLFAAEGLFKFDITLTSIDAFIPLDYIFCKVKMLMHLCNVPFHIRSDPCYWHDFHIVHVYAKNSK